jgi:iron complex outermembrane receptor protein
MRLAATSSPALIAVLTAVLAVQPACAQDGEADGADVDANQIVVIAGRYFGGVDAPQLPIVTLDEAEIASYGAGSLAELVQSLGSRTGSGRARGAGFPVVLVNGQRISGFRELRNYPPESVKRVEVLPEEVAQRYGFAPDQRVVNFILKDNFLSREIELEYGQPTSGGFHTREAELTFLRIKGPNRLNLDLEYNDSSMLTEAERGVIQRDAPEVAGDPDPARYRSLVDDSKELAFNGTWTRGLGDSGGTISLNASANRKDSLALRGLDSVLLVAPDGTSALRMLDRANPLANDRRVSTYALAGTFDHPLGDWRLTATMDASHTRSRTFSDRRADVSALEDLAAAGGLAINGVLPALERDGGRDRALTRQDSLTSLVTLVGTPLELPAGDLSATVKLGYDWDRIASDDSRNPGAGARLRRGDISGGVDISIPLTSKREDVLGALGDITLSLGFGIDRYSDFGTLKDWSTGLTWQISPGLSLQASYIWRQTPPLLTDLGSPEILLLNEPLFDFSTGQTVLAAVTTGGNRLLKPETQRDIKLSASWDLPFLKDVSFLAEYFRNRSKNVTAAFPLLTPAIEAAFPDRVTRDSSGRLVALDRRPVTLAGQSWKRLRYGIEYSGKLGKPPPPPPEGARPATDPRAMMRGGMGQGRWNVSAYHTVEFANRVLVATGGPRLDLLHGDALETGGAPRHKAEIQIGFFHKGMGGRLTANYASATRVRGSGLAGSSDLRFGSLATLDLGLFVDLGEPGRMGKDPGIFKNMRLFLKFDNLLDTRQKVRDQNGLVPLRYQPGLVDPVGRLVSIQLRKIF